MRCSAKILRGFGASLAALAIPTASSGAQEASGPLEIRAELGIEARWFSENRSFQGQLNGVQSSLFLEPELRWQDDSNSNQILVVPFFRLDSRDDERTHFDLREAYWRHIEDEWDILVGVNRVFWGVTESRHLVNIINQIDALEDVDEEDFLGQPMVQFGRQTDLGRLDLFLMTGFRERTFPGKEGRLRSPVTVRSSAAKYESDAREWRPELALRYSHFWGDVDLGLHLFQGTGREPKLVPEGAGTRLVPEYSIINQAGLDLQYTTDAWLWKFEGLLREGQGSTFSAGVLGFEYTFFQVAESDADLGLIFEGLYDGRDADVFPTLFDRDVFLGTRLAFNDVQSTELLAGLVSDVDDGLASLRVEASRRIGSTLRFELEAQAFFEEDASNPAASFQNDSFLSLGLTYFY